MKEQVILYRLLEVILYINGSCADKNTQKTSWSILFLVCSGSVLHLPVYLGVYKNRSY